MLLAPNRAPNRAPHRRPAAPAGTLQKVSTFESPGQHLIGIAPKSMQLGGKAPTGRSKLPTRRAGVSRLAKPVTVSRNTTAAATAAKGGQPQPGRKALGALNQGAQEAGQDVPPVKTAAATAGNSVAGSTVLA